MLITGIESIDKLKIPSNTAFLVLGKPQTAKLLFLEQTIYHSLRAGMYCIFITTEKTPLTLLKDFQRFKWDVREAIQERKLIFIDCCSNYLERPSRLEGSTIIQSLSALNDIMIALTHRVRRIPKDAEFLIILHSLSMLFHYNKEDEIFRFLQLLNLRFNTERSILLIELDESTHPEKVINTIQHIVENAIEFRKDITGSIRIKGTIETEWFKYVITTEGLMAIS
ncbi:MAG: RAD55 family ATPase [Candidatus Nanoarchaeia archaeon]|nr:RAD55 family ATPase [Candidatus Haiyanarchaeum thermophilum]MCW1303345.1 RAD55 family ATPase [Candidatus Haiyanarchaeum thermophilum]MCW1304073.1 RAD55 family ATPase [Candidatus Haiyanarchaeum thermophilum]MCW1306505.1 RAD55 family ATPase [Candidatus Haiyanarchaeum thermophilum]MCW1307543.1 RAD55 family ATPase [Candidatus Haiyanarchaeum thermophilum]